MVQPAPRPGFGFDDYLNWEHRQAIRHEFVRGEIFAMTGASDFRNELSGNFYAMLRQHLRGTPCRAFMADVKVRIEAADCGFYPDVLVSRADSDRADRYVKRSPVLVIEVLSASTAAFDIGDKVAAYRQLDRLREYVPVDQERIRVQIYRRAAEQWIVHSVGPGERRRLDSVDFECPAEKIHEDLSEPLAADSSEPERRSC